MTDQEYHEQPYDQQPREKPGQHQFIECKNCGKVMVFDIRFKPHTLGVLCSYRCERENMEFYL